jgi:hypothetical protein
MNNHLIQDFVLRLSVYSAVIQHLHKKNRPVSTERFLDFV